MQGEMTRGRSQVLWGYTPNATFRYNNDKGWCIVTDVQMNKPFPLEGVLADALADKYRDLFSIFVKHSDKIDRVTLWGVHDGQSWKNNWPVPGRTARISGFARPPECLAHCLSR